MRLKNRIAIILVYFGKFPNYFDLWLKSAEHNQMVDFLLFTDDGSEIVGKYENIIVHETTLKEVVALAKCALRMNCVIPTPYKLCDYKPAYGLIFEKYLQEYEFWGHCDPDIIWGDIETFVTPEILQKYDKIFNLGHLTLYRNTVSNNSKIKRLCTGVDYTYYEAFKMPINVAFDEKSAIIPFSNHGVWNMYDNKEWIADIWPDQKRYRTFYTYDSDYDHIYEYNRGKLIGHFICDGQLYSKEFLYLHMQGRKMEINARNLERYLIVPDQFVDFCPVTCQMIKEHSNDKTPIQLNHPILDPNLMPVTLKILRKIRRTVFYHLLKKV